MCVATEAGVIKYCSLPKRVSAGRQTRCPSFAVALNGARRAAEPGSLVQTRPASSHRQREYSFVGAGRVLSRQVVGHSAIIPRRSKCAEVIPRNLVAISIGVAGRQP